MKLNVFADVENVETLARLLVVSSTARLVEFWGRARLLALGAILWPPVQSYVYNTLLILSHPRTLKVVRGQCDPIKR